MRNRVGQRSPTAFSLVELLVVIAVISVVAGLLLPVVARSRKSAHHAKCVSNLRQLGLAADMYWDEHEGATFRFRGVATNNGDVFWFGWLAAGAEGERAFDYSEGPLYPYLENWNVTLCPTFNYYAPNLKLKAKSPTCGYGVNLYLTAPHLDNINAMRRPSETIAFTDSAQINTFQAPASPSNPMIEEFYYLSTNKFEATVHFRHRQSANAVFGDGHVDREKPHEGSLDTRLPDEVVGRVPPEKLTVR
jgi:prepilin-type N-terminal cleavage/methylation domain-containing protein/prepilin-type processing-associated H-X9-DG protein